MEKQIFSGMFSGNRIFDTLTERFKNTFPTETLIKQGMCGPHDVGICREHPATGMQKKAKLSLVSIFFERIENREINAISLKDDVVYVEWTVKTKGGDTEEFAATFDGKNVKYLDDPSCPNPRNEDNENWLIPIFVYTIRNNSTMEVKDFTKKYVDLIGEKHLDEPFAALYGANDSFYYEFATKNTRVEVFSGLTKEELNSAIRTGGTTKIDAMDKISFSLPDFKNIDVKTEEEPKTTATTSVSDDSELLSGAKRLDPDLWNIDQLPYIPSTESLKEFIPSDAYHAICKMVEFNFSRVIRRMEEGLSGAAAIKNDYINLQMVGRPGTGKTTIANAIGATFGIPVRVVACSKNTEEDTFTGMTKVSSGGFSFQETAFIDAYKNGGIIILEEFNLSDPGVMMGALGQAIEKPFILLEDGVREVHRHPLCIIIATMNVGTQGAREPSEALTSRMPNVFLLDDPEDSEFINILKKNTECTAAMARKTHKMYKKILAYLTDPSVNEDQVALSLSLRHCLACIKMQQYGTDFKTSVKDTMIGTIAIKDIDLARHVFEDVVQTAKD